MKRILFSLFCLLMLGSLAAQGIDLSNLTPAQKAAYQKYMSGTFATQVQTTSATEDVAERTVDAGSNEVTSYQIKTDSLTVFGSKLFNSHNLTFEPKLNIPTPPGYILGTLDELIVDISGLYEANYKLKVNSEGTIRIPNVGPVKVSGMRMDAATRFIRSRLSVVYQGVSSGQTSVNVILGNIRSIRLTVVGEAAMPGTYMLPSLATAFNALYACGGPGANGSMRDIKVIRDNKVVATIDVYKFLFEGQLADNISLQDEDVLKIEPYKKRVSVKGAVKNPGIFETIEGETLNNLISYTGGFSDNAFKGSINLLRLTDSEKTVVDISENKIDGFSLKSGDVYTISATDNKFDNRVDIRGYVLRPGAYALVPEMTVSQLISKSGGLRKDAYLNMAYIIRKKDNQIPEVIGFNLGDIIKGVSQDIILQKDDYIEIKSLFNYSEAPLVPIEFEGLGIVRVEGEVIKPGVYNILNKFERISDLIKRTDGFTKYAYPLGAYLIRTEQTTDVEQKFRQIMAENTKKQLQSTGKSIDASMLKAVGVSSIKEVMNKTMGGADDSVMVDEIFKKEGLVGINLEEIINNPGGKYDLYLEEGDVIYVPRELQTVRVLGEVLFPTYVRYDNNMSFKDYISNAGGFSINANTKNAFVLYANGTVKGTKSFLGFRSYPAVKPGSRIMVPEKPIQFKNKLTPGETATLISSLATVAALIVSILK